MIYMCSFRNLCSRHFEFTFLNLKSLISPVKTQFEIRNFKFKLLIFPTPNKETRWRKNQINPNRDDKENLGSDGD